MYDLIIVGAGPAGIFTALELLRKSCNPHKIQIGRASCRERV